MSYTERHENISKEDWITRLEGSHLQRTDMNKLIMNYLVTDGPEANFKMYDEKSESKDFANVPAADSSPPPLATPSNENIETLNPGPMEGLHKKCQEGFKEAAEKFQQESGITPSVELDSLDDRIRIRDAIQNSRIQEATSLVNQLHPELLDNDRYLHFHLQQLHLIELIRSGLIEEAIHFAQNQLSEAGESDPAVLNELERTLALLAFEDPLNCPFSDLLHPTHRQKVASELNAAILKMENRETSTPKLCNVLKLILWAQDELDKKKIKYPKMTNLAAAYIENPK